MRINNDIMTNARGDREFTTEIYNNEVEKVKQITIYLNPDRIVAECHQHYESEKGWIISVPRGTDYQEIIDTMNSIKSELEDYVNNYGEYADGYEDSMSDDEKDNYLSEFFEAIRENFDKQYIKM